MSIYNVLHNFNIPENLYRDLQSQASWRHHKLNEEIRIRLQRTLIESYGYNYLSDLTDRIRKGAYNLYTNPEKPRISFNFYMSKEMISTIEGIISVTNYRPQSNKLNEEIIKRLAYTLMDPFYDDFE